MNDNEKRMLAILEQGRAECGIVAVKAEFEAEGTRSDELLRLLEIARRAGVKVGIKIGGCEAIRDIIECRQYGVDYMISPMIETPYALKKFVDGKNKFYPANEQPDVGFLFNVETITGFSHLEEMGKVAAAGNVGMVFGRVDFAGSLGHTRDFVNTPEMERYIADVAQVAKQHDLDLVVGGGVSPESIDLLSRIREIRLDRFETRKVIFDAASLDKGVAKQGMELAIEFELLWLKNKRDYYNAIGAEDAQRIAMMEARQAEKANA